MRPCEKYDEKAASQKVRMLGFLNFDNVFVLTMQGSDFAAEQNRAGYLDSLLILFFRLT